MFIRQVIRILQKCCGAWGVCECEREIETDVTVQQIAGSSGEKQKGVLQQAERTQAIKCMNRDTANLIIAQDTAEKERENMSETQRQRHSHLMSTLLSSVVITFTWLHCQTHLSTQKLCLNVGLLCYLQGGELRHVAEGERGKKTDAVITEVSAEKTHTNTQQILLHTPSEQCLQHAFTIQNWLTLRKEI